MKASDVLNADVSTVWTWVQQGFRWWFAELEAMLPSGRPRTTAADRLLAERDGSGGLRVWRSGLPVSAPKQGRVELVLAEGAVLERDIDLPLLRPADQHRLLTLDMDRLTPFDPEHIWFDTTEVDGPAGGRLRRLGVVPRAEVNELLRRVNAAGLKPTRVSTGDPAQPESLRYDFLAQARQAERGGGRGGLAWSAVALLLAANLTLLVFRDVADVRQLRATVDSQRPAALRAVSLRRSIETEEARRNTLLQRRADRDPLRIVSALTRALPTGQWVRRLEWNGEAVRVSGFQRDGFDVAAALRGSPALTNPRALEAELPEPNGRGQAFDFTAAAERAGS